MSTPLLFISAGDPSGDNATSHVVEALQKMTPGLTVFGLGGPKLKALGQEQMADAADLAVLGFWEVVKRASYFRNLLDKCEREIAMRKPSCVMLVDYPGFNLRLAKRVRRLGIPIVYYISPQIWAWGKRRIADIKELVDLMIVILPFEQEFYRSHGVRAEFVGHYLLEDIPREYIRSPLPNSGRIALLPGSRPQEIDRMLMPMLETAAEFNRKFGTKAVVAGLKNGYDYAGVASAFEGKNIEISFEDSRKILFESDLALTASGTATLEAGVIGRPMVIVYKTGFVTYQIARRLVKIDRIGLVNLVLGEKVVPELIQGDAGPINMGAALARYREDSGYRAGVKERLDTVAGLLGGTGASGRAARWVAKYL